MQPETGRRLRTALKLIVLVLATSLAGYWIATRPMPLGDIALDDYRLPDQSGQYRRLSEWKGKALLINFWATWCEPCRREMPDLAAVHEALSGESFEIIGIAIDRPAAVLRFLEEIPVGYPILLDDGAASQLLSDLGNAGGGLPFTVAVDADGRIRDRHLGALPEAKLLEWAESLF